MTMYDYSIFDNIIFKQNFIEINLYLWFNIIEINNLLCYTFYAKNWGISRII